MMNLDRKYKNRFNKLELSDQDEEDIINKIKLKYNKNQKRKKYILCFITVMIIGFLSIGIAYATEIEDFVKGFIITKTKENAEGKNFTHTEGESNYRKEINYEANLPEVGTNDEGKEYSILELENLLNIKILKSDYFKTTILKQVGTVKKEGKIASASFKLENFSCTKDVSNSIADRYNMYVYFITKYADADDKISWETGRDTKVTEYYLKNLNTTAYILHPKNENKMLFYTVHFIYDNVGYSFRLRITNDEIEDRKIKLKEILDSLHY